MTEDRDTPAAAPPRGGLARILGDPRVDKAFAMVGSLPFVLVIAVEIRNGRFGIPAAVLTVHMLLQLGTLLARRPPERVTPNPLFWLLAFTATYWTFLTAGFARTGRPLVSAWAADGLSLLSLAVVVYARLSLGRNIGFVPAQRQLVMHGAYRYVRHPIYSGIFLAYAGSLLSNYDRANLLVALGGIALFMIKSVVEERFLAADPAYREYLRQVRWRWVPGLA
ncbi:MAG: methyltransferase [Nevskia sp.]|nr:methyltransferase [Nevskia sp.]